MPHHPLLRSHEMHRGAAQSLGHAVGIEPSCCTNELRAGRVTVFVWLRRSLYSSEPFLIDHSYLPRLSNHPYVNNWKVVEALFAQQRICPAILVRTSNVSAT